MNEGMHIRKLKGIGVIGTLIAPFKGTFADSGQLDEGLWICFFPEVR